MNDFSIWYYELENGFALWQSFAQNTFNSFVEFIKVVMDTIPLLTGIFPNFIGVCIGVVCAIGLLKLVLELLPLW